MIVLGLETSTALCGVCLLRDEEVLAERSIVAAHVHSEKLLTLVSETLAEGKLQMSEMSAVAVSIGPGSFTGLRIGLSSAKGFCYALEKPLVTVPTFDAIAETARRSGSTAERIAIALDAKHDEYYVATYSRAEGGYSPAGKVEVLPGERVKERLQSFKAELIVTDTQEIWEQELGDEALFGNLMEYCRAESVARIARIKVQTKEFADLASVGPMYLKDFVVKGAR